MNVSPLENLPAQQMKRRNERTFSCLRRHRRNDEEVDQRSDTPSDPGQPVHNPTIGNQLKTKSFSVSWGRPQKYGPSSIASLDA